MRIDRYADAFAGFHIFSNETDDEVSFEVWFAEDYEADFIGPAGWYWRERRPDTPADTEADGPYSTSEQAFNAARGKE